MVSPEEYLRLMEDAVARWPDSRFAHEGLARALAGGHEESQETSDAQRIAREFLAAAEIGLRHGRFRYVSEVANALGDAGDNNALDQFFGRVLASDEVDPALATLSYAQGLAKLDDPRADMYFLKAINLAPEGQWSTRQMYVEYLFEKHRPQAVLDLLSPQMEAEAFGTDAERSSEAEIECQKARESAPRRMTPSLGVDHQSGAGLHPGGVSRNGAAFQRKCGGWMGQTVEKEKSAV
jgi:hypothetical protein